LTREQEILDWATIQQQEAKVEAGSLGGENRTRPGNGERTTQAST
jgi:hypothetical protein